MANIGNYYVETLQPGLLADSSNVTLTTTHKALWATGANGPTILNESGFWYPGRMLRLTALIKMSSGTAGNYTYAMALGTGDNPAVIVQSAARAYVASVGPFTIFMQGLAICRSIGSAATISMWGMAYTDLALQLSTNQPNTFPQAGTTVVSTFDSSLTTLSLTFQMIASAGTHTATCVGGPVLEILS